MRFSRSLPPNSTHVSSAYSTVNSNSDTLKMSLVNMIKRRGPKIRGVARGGAAGYICPRAPRYRGAKMRLTKLSQG